MQNSQDQISILLIGNPGDGLENAEIAFMQAGYRVIKADDGREGFRLARRERPALIVSEINLPEISGLDLCRMIRMDRELGATPFIVVGETGQKDGVLIEAFRTGADDFLAQDADFRHLAAKTAWLIERKNADESLKQYYQILRDRQYQIAGIIKGVTELFADSDFDARSDSSCEVCSEPDKRISLGISMVGALANLLDEQIKAISIGERSLRGDIYHSDQARHGGRLFEPYPVSYESVID